MWLSPFTMLLGLFDLNPFTPTCYSVNNVIVSFGLFCLVIMMIILYGYVYVCILFIDWWRNYSRHKVYFKKWFRYELRWVGFNASVSLQSEMFTDALNINVIDWEDVSRPTFTFPLHSKYCSSNLFSKYFIDGKKIFWYLRINTPFYCKV